MTKPQGLMPSVELHNDQDEHDPDFDVIVIGGGITGLHQLHRMKEAGFSVRLLEAGGGVGGTWYWNRYPAARSDSEIYTYGYFFSKEMLEEWTWTEHFAAQPQIEAYLNYAVDKLGLRDDISFNTRVEAATFDDATNLWTLSGADGTRLRARFVIAATGILSVPFYPDVPGKDDFRGESYHTGGWPAEPVDFVGKRVAIIGVGASAVQLLPAIVDEVASVTVYQRTANWCAPLNNSPITSEEQARIGASFDELYRTCHSTFSGFMHQDNGRNTFDDTPEERLRTYEEIWNDPGHTGLFGNYSDLLTDQAANDEFCTFLAAKIRAIVEDPVTAEKLIPKDHGFGMKRPPLENGYYAAFNNSKVSLVDLRAEPFVKITETGIVNTDGERDFDIIVWATGFDAVTGALTHMGIKGSAGQSLAEYWADGPRTYVGIQSPGFPNLLFVGGPHGTYGNIPRSTETHVEFVTGLLTYMRERGYNRIEPDESAEEKWTDHVYEGASKILVADTAWYTGSNIPGKAKRFLVYIGGLVAFREKVTEVAENEYDGFIFAKRGANTLQR
jgi:cation diffusion facilitator CzcD-associated flavoprotein CzcO